MAARLLMRPLKFLVICLTGDAIRVPPAGPAAPGPLHAGASASQALCVPAAASPGACFGVG